MMSYELTVIKTELFKIDSNESIRALAAIDIKYDCTLADIRKIGTPPISALVKEGNKAECYKLIKTMLILFNQYVGITFNDYQLTEMAKDLYSKYFYWHQADLINFFRKCRNMEFDKVLSANQITPIIIMKWADLYDKEWLDESIEQREREHDQLTYDSNRRDEIYRTERALSEKKQTDLDTIKRMREVIQQQQERLKNE